MRRGRERTASDQLRFTKRRRMNSESPEREETKEVRVCQQWKKLQRGVGHKRHGWERHTRKTKTGPPRLGLGSNETQKKEGSEQARKAVAGSRKKKVENGLTYDRKDEIKWKARRELKINSIGLGEKEGQRKTLIEPAGSIVDPKMGGEGGGAPK